MLSTVDRDTFRPPPNTPRRRARRNRRAALVLVVLLVAAGIGWTGYTVYRSCDAASGSQRFDGECIGLSDGSYTFGNADLTQIGLKIKAENDRVAAQADQNGRAYVRIALLAPLSVRTNRPGPLPDESILHLVEGAYLGQVQENQKDTKLPADPQVQLILVNEGSREQQWPTVVEQIEDQTTGPHPIAGVVGLGVSWPETRAAARSLAEHGIPMVGAALSADGLNAGTYESLLNVSPSNHDFVAALANYLDAGHHQDTALIMRDTADDDYTNNLYDDFRAIFKAWIGAEQQFTGQGRNPGGQPPSFSYVTQNVCLVHPRYVFFTGRPSDLKRFIDALTAQDCEAHPPITVVAGATGLSSSSLSDEARRQNISILFATSDNAEKWERDFEQHRTTSGYGTFHQLYQEKLRPVTVAALEDGYAVMHYDAVLTLVRAIRMAANDPALTDAQRAAPPALTDIVRDLTAINGNYKIEGATGTLEYSSSPDSAGRAEHKHVPVLLAGPDGGHTQVAQYETPVDPPKR